jgi:LacI family transcriptional regulator, galactose operon repressor
MPTNRGNGPLDDDHRPTMHDVAGLAGVSLKTVSRVFNHQPNVRPELRARVQRAAASVGFRPNIVAKNLRTGRATTSVGLVIADLLNPFYGAIATAVEAVANRNSAIVILGSSGEDPAREEQVVTDLLDRHVDGLIVVPTAGADHSYLESERRLGIHVVFVDRPAIGNDADAVVLDNVGGAHRGTQHLLNLGHTRIGFVGDSQILTTAQERLAGYRLALDEAGVTFDPALVRAEVAQADQAESAARQLLTSADPPTAIFAVNNRTCIGVVRAIRSLNRPVALVGFDDFELADLLAAPVSVIGYDPGELGRAGAELLFARMGGDVRPPQRIVIPTRLIVRGSAELRVEQLDVPVVSAPASV